MSLGPLAGGCSARFHPLDSGISSSHGRPGSSPVLPTQALPPGTLWVKSGRREAESALDAACRVSEAGTRVSGVENPHRVWLGPGFSVPGGAKPRPWTAVSPSCLRRAAALCPSPGRPQPSLLIQPRPAKAETRACGGPGVMPRLSRGLERRAGPLESKWR